jgi:hypothetical protein
MEYRWFRQDKPAVLDALRRGERPLMATTMAAGPLDELVALHIELGVFEALDAVPVARGREGIAEALLLRTLATLPFLPEEGLGPAAHLVFQEPAIAPPNPARVGSFPGGDLPGGLLRGAGRRGLARSRRPPRAPRTPTSTT